MSSTTPSTHFPRETAVDVRNLRFRYGSHEAVKGIDLSIARGEIFALLGTNGAGKTTTLELIQGYRVPSEGTVTAFDLDPVKDGRALRRRAGFMMQEAGLIPEMTVRESLCMWRDLSSRRDDVDATLAKVELTHKASTRVEALSGGERRRLDLAMTIWGSPELIVLDEPTTGLDPDSRQTLWRLVRNLKEQGSTIILTTHYLDEAQALADSVAMMHQGQVAVQVEDHPAARTGAAHHRNHRCAHLRARPRPLHRFHRLPHR
ncbi:enoyl-CoA hydratase [Platysternon megacephalum]|uniref:Enoyl-CoA hydratase n=1 Tax=Platysternon megacephalum TaxID=55544 RepID=A0A4D9DB58_9SAUR|nr:enoyl-CoA hydratase [Platysternon megacephalum]